MFKISTNQQFLPTLCLTLPKTKSLTSKKFKDLISSQNLTKKVKYVYGFKIRNLKEISQKIELL